MISSARNKSLNEYSNPNKASNISTDYEANIPDLTQLEARQIIDEWLSSKKYIYSPDANPSETL